MGQTRSVGRLVNARGPVDHASVGLAQAPVVLRWSKGEEWELSIFGKYLWGFLNTYSSKVRLKALI